jgi:iron(II)-dependent oxidoreductase
MFSPTAPAILTDLLIRWTGSRRETDGVFDLLTPSARYDRPIPERHRIVFYIGHLEAFDWNLLREHLGLDRFHPEFDQLFAFGIDPVDGGLPTDELRDWPTMQAVENYRRRIRQELDASTVNAAETKELTELLNIAIEHRLMHAETLEYMLHQLPFSRKVRPDSEEAIRAEAVAPEMVELPPGEVMLGLSRDSGQFGWDNEFDSHVVDLPAFRIDKYKVTNREFAQFMNAGGYTQRSFWSDVDWEWRSNFDVSHPVFWVPAGDGFHYRTMFDEIPLPPDAPVYVSHAEASAYAKWAGKSLPTEAEWQRAAEGANPPSETRKLWDPLPAGSSLETRSLFGVEDLLGNGWEWTSTLFEPFSGFQITPAYPGYSAGFFDGKHFVLKGGSTRTAACMLRKSFRNWFQPHYQYVYAGFRCVTR